MTLWFNLSPFTFKFKCKVFFVYDITLSSFLREARTDDDRVVSARKPSDLYVHRAMTLRNQSTVCYH